MGTSFFKGAGAPKSFSAGNTGQEARAIGQSAYGVRAGASGAQKGISQAQAINKAGAFKPMKRSAAYPKGPKV